MSTHYLYHYVNQRLSNPFDDAKVAPFLDVHNSRNPLVKVPVKQLPILKKFL